MTPKTNEYQLLHRCNSPEFASEKQEEDRVKLLAVGYDEEASLESSDARIPHRHHNHQNSFKGHVEEHFSRPELVRDCILGLSDGLTVPFALAAGLSSLGDTRIVIYGGLAGKCL